MNVLKEKVFYTQRLMFNLLSQMLKLPSAETPRTAQRFEPKNTNIVPRIDSNQKLLEQIAILVATAYLYTEKQ